MNSEQDRLFPETKEELREQEREYHRERIAEARIAVNKALAKASEAEELASQAQERLDRFDRLCEIEDRDYRVVDERLSAALKRQGVDPHTGEIKP